MQGVVIMAVHIHIHKKYKDSMEGSVFHAGQIASAIRLVEAQKDLPASEKQAQIAKLKKMTLSEISRELQGLLKKARSAKDSTKEATYTSLYQMEKAVVQMKTKGWFVISHVKQPDGTFNVKYQQGAGTR